MSLKVAVLKETRAGERRVAMVPAVVDKLVKFGAEVWLQAGAGAAVSLPDNAYRNVTITADLPSLVGDADLVLAVQPPSLEIARAMREGAVLISFVYAHREPELVKLLRDRRITCFAMELVPRITRAQAMDALSSQAALAGYYAVLLAGTELPRILPRMTTATGTLRPATVLVIGLGVAGLQSIATARRLGAVVEGYDVRPETREEAASLGAKFVDTGVDARGEGGYARELTAEEKEKVAAALTRHIQQADVVITTAAVPGRPAPKLISKTQVDGMKNGAVIIDLAAEGGGNCEYTKPGETIRIGQITIAAPLNVPSLLGEHASELYAKNVLNLLELLVKDQSLALDWEDEVVAKTALTHAGKITNEAARTAVESAQRTETAS
ncbi:MAG: NAD(P) transhydrogenase subunit alpha [Gemmatimonadaceae bacterium]